MQRYWEWQETTNGPTVTLFFETFCGNNLCFYPRGLVCFGMLDAMLGLRIDRVTGLREAKPLSAGFRGPVLLEADWVEGTAPRCNPYSNTKSTKEARRTRRRRTPLCPSRFFVPLW